MRRAGSRSWAASAAWPTAQPVQPLPRESRLPAAGPRALSRGDARDACKAFAHDQLAAERARGRLRRAGRRRISARRCRRRRRRRSRRARAPSRSTPTRRGATSRRSRARAAAHAADADVVHAAERPDGDPQRAARRADRRRRTSSSKTGSDANPLDKPGPRELHGGDARRRARRRATRCRSPTTSRSSARRSTRVQPMDASFVTVQSLTKNFAARARSAGRRRAASDFPADGVERQRASRLGAARADSEDPGDRGRRRSRQRRSTAPTHPYGFIELGTEASVKAMTRDDLVGVLEAELRAEQRGARRRRRRSPRRSCKPLAEKAFGAWQKGTPRRPALGTMLDDDRARALVDRRQAGRAADAAARGRRSARRARRPTTRAIEVMNLIARRAVLEPHQPNLREEHGYTYGAFSQFEFRRRRARSWSSRRSRPTSPRRRSPRSSRKSSG